MLADVGLVFNFIIEMAPRARLKCWWFVTQDVAYNDISLCELDTVFHLFGFGTAWQLSSLKFTLCGHLFSAVKIQDDFLS